MKTSLVTALTLLMLGLLVALPLLGVMAAGLPLGRYLEFPPHSHYVAHHAFSWPVFAGLALLILGVIAPFILRMLSGSQAEDGRNHSPPRTQRAQMMPALLVRIMARCSLRSMRSNHPGRPPAPAARRFPAWGWLGIAGGICFWILAWSRFTWFTPLQAFTFSPLWFSYIAVVNALTWRRTGQCMLTHQPRFFLLLFPVSAAFWWSFEYLNRFVQNWYYTGVDGLPPWEYFLFATLPFSTVLPAVLGTYQLLAAYPRLSNGLTGVFIIPANADRPQSGANCRINGGVSGSCRTEPVFSHSSQVAASSAPTIQFSIRLNSRWIAGTVLILSAAGLAGIGAWPDYIFPLLWLAPLGLLASLQTLAGRPPAILAGPARGDWRRVVLLALAALICGIFWEMWNFYSAAKWVYAVPFVNRFHIFEMPVLGYAGYLPFGLECALIGDLLADWLKRRTILS